MSELLRWAWIGRPRAITLVTLALAAVVDLACFAALVGDDERPGPAEVARRVVQAIADDDCSGVGDLLEAEVQSPTIASCLAGTPSPVALSDVEVVGDESVNGTAAVTVSVDADGEPSRVVVVLRLVEGDWLVSGIRSE